ncbi:MAG: hypothetical protein AAFO80_12610, partial [Pseudomonadota bacterium]
DAEDVAWFRETKTTMVGVSMIGGGNLEQAQVLLHDVLLKWQALRDQKDYASADKIRDALLEMGVGVRAYGDGPQASLTEQSKLDLGKLESLK